MCAKSIPMLPGETRGCVGHCGFCKKRDMLKNFKLSQMVHICEVNVCLHTKFETINRILLIVFKP